jgi:hypothetical protein
MSTQRRRRHRRRRQHTILSSPTTGPGGSAVSTVSMLGSLFVVLMFQMRPSLQTTAPANFLLLGLFTAFESVLVGMLTLM